jgi:hypothetical protein
LFKFANFALPLILAYWMARFVYLEGGGRGKGAGRVGAGGRGGEGGGGKVTSSANYSSGTDDPTFILYLYVIEA